ncbi:MAG: FtsQ-type POTRA domain-containing protein [Verrucomicrobiota bacterium]|nr:FtsQ-type POTRA domain-containing protein [Verrucomicrobiota bacterium]
MRNQRVSNTRQRKQQHLLDVKVRSHTAIQHRNHRLLVISSKIILCLLICGGLAWGIRYGANRLFFENPDYRISKIEVQTDGTLQRDQVLKTAELVEGENIFSVNLARVHDRLEQLPQVNEVQVVRNMPSEINIQIVERKPVAWITSEKEITDPFASDGAFLVDALGRLMKQKKLLPEYLGLPLIVGCTSESLVAGKTVDSFEGKAALELLRLSTRSFMQTRFQVREIDVSKGYCLVVTDKNRTRVTFGFDNLETQLQRLEQFLVYTDDSRQELETVNLLVQRNIPVTFAKTPSEVINETIDPEGQEPKILKATPVNPNTKSGAAKQKSSAAAEKPRKAVPVERGRRN